MGRKYFSYIMSQVSAAFDGLDEVMFAALIDECKHTILRGGKIIASGLGKNVMICEKFVGTMNSLGLESAFLHSNTAMHGDLGLVKDNDLILILSKSGNTTESLCLAEYIQSWPVKKWLLSFNTGGELGKIVVNKLLLPLDHEGDKWDIVPNNSSSCYLILLQGLALYLAECLDITLVDFKRNHPGGAIGKKLMEDTP